MWQAALFNLDAHFSNVGQTTTAELHPRKCTPILFCPYYISIESKQKECIAEHGLVLRAKVMRFID